MKLLTKEIRNSLPKLYAQERLGDDAIVLCKFFTPDSSWTWYVTEGQPVYDDHGHEIDFRFFGLVQGHEVELGYFMLSDLETTKGPMGIAIERDLYWHPVTLREVRKHIDMFAGNPMTRDEQTIRNLIDAEAQGDSLDDARIEDEYKVQAESGEMVTLKVSGTHTKADLLKYGRYLVNRWCDCKRSEFLCYPGDGECLCGTHKHHVHCKNCGGISQIG